MLVRSCMTSRLSPVWALLIVTAGWGFVGTSWPLHATGRREGAPVERLTATAVSLNKAGLPPTSVEIEISIDRWSTDDERDRLVDTLKGKGSRALIEQLRSYPSIGYIGTATSRGWGLRFAQTRPLDDGGRQVIIATDRPMSFNDTKKWRRQTVDYPFSLIDIRFDRSGTGVGKLAFASNLTHNTKTGTIEIDNYGGEPARLTNVRSTQGPAPAPPHEQAELAKQLSNPITAVIVILLPRATRR